ncbi:MAG: MarR family winged helix-turn-helix transcriptional regulator, partial [Lactococcus chungangensis]
EKSDYPDETRGLQIWVIDYLIKHQDEDIFQRDLEKEFVMRRSTATNFVKKMEQAGLIRRESVAYDARLKKIILTDKAFELQAGMMAKKKEFETLLRGDLSEAEIKQFIATIQKIKHNLQEQ